MILDKKLETAKLCSIQNNYELAINEYSEILEEMSEVSDADLKKNEIFIEYADVLIKNFTEEAGRSLKLLLENSTAGFDMGDSDLEIAWDVTQIALQTFTDSKNGEKVRECHKLLGEILLLNNNFLGAISEFETIFSENLEKSEKIFILGKIGQCYEFLEDEKFKEFYQKIIEISDDEEEKQAYKDLIDFFQEKKNVREVLKNMKPKVVDKFDEDEEFVDLTENVVTKSNPSDNFE